MPNWTNEMDAALRQARETIGPDGSWGDVAAGMALLGFDVSRDAVKNRAARLGMQSQASAGRGWEPGLSWKGDSGSITTGPLDSAPDWAEVLQVWNLDPEVYEVIEPVQFRAWDAPDGEGGVRRLFYYKANICRRVKQAVDLDEIIAHLHDYPPEAKTPFGVTFTPWSYVVAVADPQIGKAGTEETVTRFREAAFAAYRRLTDLALRYGDPEHIFIFSLGDVIEGCSGHYAMQTFEVELDRRSQLRLARNLYTDLIETLAFYSVPLTVAAVAGNHGENRQGGKAFTTFGDNDDLAIFEQLQEAFARDDRYRDAVDFIVPDNDLTLSVKVSGQRVGLAHGHQARNGDLLKWWRDQTFGGREVADADILLTGHFHYLHVVQSGSKTWIQAPTLDSGSQWFAETAGDESKPGLLTLAVTPEGWGDLQIV